ncbi:MAG: methionyl-tRNA formyltransferase [Clostridia bacterium]
MRVIFLGTPDFAVPCLDAVAKEYEVVGVCTQPDRLGNRNKVNVCAVKQRAQQLGLPVFQFEKISREGVEILKQLNADVIITCAFGQILSQQILDLTKYGVLNVHASLLPKYRGSSPIQWCLINGETQTGVTIMKTAYAVDSGDVLLQEIVPIFPQETAGELFVRLAQIGAKALIKALKLVENGKAVFTAQNHTQATHFPMLSKTDGKIDFNSASCDIVNKVRGFNPWPSAYCFWQGKMLKIHKAESVKFEASSNEIAKNVSANITQLEDIKTKNINTETKNLENINTETKN